MMPDKTAGKFSHALLITGARTWDDEQAMRRTFNEAWRAWGPACVARPVLICGHCSEGADALAERLWRDAGFEIIAFPADWERHGRRAGVWRNQEIVSAAQVFRDAGAEVLCTAFLDLCRQPDCPHREQEQLMPVVPGHFSHGTIHCRARATDAGLDVVDVVHPALPPF